MADITEYRVIATRTSVHGEDIHVVHATDGGPTIRMIYGLAQLLAVIQASREAIQEGEE